MQVCSLGWEDPLEVGMATHSSILAWKIPWTEEPGGLQSMGLQSRTQLKGLSTHAGSLGSLTTLNFPPNRPQELVWRFQQGCTATQIS